MPSKAAALAVEREGVCFRVLREIGEREAILIGGYALSAYGHPRFSIDIDLVVAAETTPSLREDLKRLGFSPDRAWDPRGPFRFERWLLGRVSADLLIDGVFDRRSRAAFPYPDLRRTAGRRTVQALASAESARPLVASREALLAMKLASGRFVDLRDVAILAQGPLDWDELEPLLARCPAAVLRANAALLASSLETPRFRDSFKGVFRLGERAYSGYPESAGALCRRIQDYASRTP
ncbi:MAG TPA: nucleotidyl transferase AbiEii/AbiGii toxin family protein [Thermoplasmata archaeon]|nr:nucleotidyl transferase AbiEii/AbiGii toxin family protein [Thermoplasmata archaeon]